MCQWILIVPGIVFSLLLHCSQAQLKVPKELIDEKNVGGAGVNARLLYKGVNYVASFLANSLIVEIVTANVDIEPIEIEVGSKGKVSVVEMTLNVHNSAQSIQTSTHAPSRVAIHISDMNFSSKAGLTAQFSDISLNTTLELKAPSSMVQLNVSVLRNSQGSPNIRVDECKVLLATASESIVLTVEAMGELEALRTEVQEALNKHALELLDGLICSRITFIVEDRLNDRIGLLSPKITLAHINDDEIIDDLVERMRARRQRSANEVPLQKRDTALMNSFNMSRADNLFLDYTLVEDPSADQSGLLLKSSGEVSLRGRGGTPFGPINITLPNPPSKHVVIEDFMLQMAISDFIPNSLMYHGHTIGLFSTRIDPKTPHFGPIMRTSCTSSGLLFCLGDLFPTLRRLHPDHRLALSFDTVEAPVIKFHPVSSGGIKFSLMGRIEVILIDNLNTGAETKVAEMGIDVAAHMKMRLSSFSVRPKISLDSFRLFTLSPGILLQEELDDAVTLSREVLQRMVNDILQDGIPIPVHPLFKLNKPKVRVMERALLLQTNIDLNEVLMRQLTASDLLEQKPMV